MISLNSISCLRLFSLFFLFSLAYLFANNKAYPTSGGYSAHITPTTYTATALSSNSSSYYDLWKAEYMKADFGDYFDGLYEYFRKNPSNDSLLDLMDWKQVTCNDSSLCLSLT